MKTLLVVEDDDAFRDAVTRHLTEIGYVIIPVRTTMEALDVIDSKCEFDALLIDIYMPRGNAHGIAVARMARQRRSKLPILFMTAYPEEIEESQGLGKVLIKVLRKPLPLDQLTDEIHALFTIAPAP